MKKFFCIFMTIWVTVGAVMGTYKFTADMESSHQYTALIMVGLLSLCMSIWLLPIIADAFQHLMNRLSKRPVQDIISLGLGLIIGLLIAALLNTILKDIPVIGSYVSLVCYLFLGYVGAVLFYRSRKDIMQILKGRGKEVEKNQPAKAVQPAVPTVCPKILDTSVIIDGRIGDVCHTGFIEGQFVVPQFVLDELRHVSDSSDVLKRNRGRRGLDILHRLQKDFPQRVEITDIDYLDIPEVDNKLLKLAQDIGGVVVTNDFNLNKVAKLQGVTVLNINELSSALKPVVLPGETMQVEVVSVGKELNQGVAYLDDGTMIVIENGKQHLGNTIDVEVSSVLQTAAGRMIFVRAK